MDEKIKKIKERISKEKQRNVEHYEKIEDENKRLKDKLPDLKDRSHRDNLHFDWVREYENESWNDTEEVLKDFLLNIWAYETSKLKVHIEPEKEIMISQEQL